MHWLPRALSVLFIIFITAFAFDTLSKPQWYLALLIHLIPTFILIIATVLAWKNQLVGGIIFALMGACSIIFIRSGIYIISLPLIIIGILYFVSKNNEKRKND